MATREIRLGSIKGLSSYELAVKSGTFTGTLIEYLNKEQQYYNDMVLYGDALKDELGGIDADTINAIMADAVKYEDFATYADMEAWLKDAANIGTLSDGDLLLIEDMDVPNYWVLEALEVTDEDTGYYYKIAELGDLFGEGSIEIDTTKLVSLDTVSANRFISSGSNVNNYLTVGQYTIAPENVNSILNIPEGASAGDLFVKTMIEDGENTFHRLQVYMTYDNTGIYTRYIHKDGADVEIIYGEWQKLATGTDFGDVKVSFDNASLTGIPTAPTADVGTNTEQIATTAFVQSAVSNLVDSAPETMNTLKELATAIEEHQDITDALDSAIGNKADKTELSNYALSEHIVSTKLNGSSFASLEEFVEATATDVTSHNMFRFKDTVGWGPCGIANLWYRCIAMYQNKYSDEASSKVGVDGTLLLWHGNTAVPYIGFIDGNKAGDNFDGVSVTWNTLAITTDIETNSANQGRYKGDLNEIPFIESGKTFIYDCRSSDCTNLPTTNHATVKVTYFDSVKYCTQECTTLGTPKSFIRVKHDDTWSDWQQLATTTDINVKVESFDSSTGTLYLAPV